MARAPITYTANRGSVHVWQCNVCGKLFEWADESEAQYYGSERDVDDGNWDKITIVCSAACRAKFERASGKHRG